MNSTIKDVAKLAQVSVTTVSFVINNTNRVSTDTKKKVLKAVKKLNYKPNLIAKSLVSKRTYDIALMVSGPNYEYLSSSYLSPLVTGIKYICDKSNYHLVIRTITDKEEYDIISKEISSPKYDGILLWGIRLEEKKLYNLIKKSNTPVVSIGRFINNNVPSVVVNDYQGSYDMTKYLISKGHTKILYLGILPNVSTGTKRYDGHINALKDNNIAIDYALHISCNFYQKEAYETINKILKEKKLKFTSIFAASDTMALGVIKALYDNNIKVPQEIALAGFDNIPNSDITIVPLTTVDTPIEELGRLSAKKILRLIKNEGDIVIKEELDVKLKIRDSI